MRRYFIETQPQGNIIFLTGEEHSHLAFVLRSKVGEQIVVCCGDGMEYICEIESISKSQTTCIVKEIKKSENETTCNVTLFQALIKLDNFELAVQKSTELGVKKIVPFTSQFSQIAPNRLNLARVQKIATEACKQCERAVVPNICSPINFNQLIIELSKFDAVVFANERTGKKDISSLLQTAKNVAVVIGCEGGFSEQEKQQLLSLKNVISLTLGKRILKAETASIVTLALTMQQLGEMQWKFVY